MKHKDNGQEDRIRKRKGLQYKGIMQNYLATMIIFCTIPLISISILSYLGIFDSWKLYALMLVGPLLHLMVMRNHMK
jgi:hypothetical protein